MEREKRRDAEHEAERERGRGREREGGGEEGKNREKEVDTQRRDVQREREIRCSSRGFSLHLAADLGVSATDGVRGVGGVAAPE